MSQIAELAQDKTPDGLSSRGARTGWRADPPCRHVHHHRKKEDTTMRDGLSRRGFLQGALGAAATALFLAPGARPAPPSPTLLGLTRGDSRPKNVYDALKLIEPQVRAGLAGKRTVVIKPNLVNTARQLSATHADCIEGLLEFFSPLVKDEIIVAESPANGPAQEAYDNYGYLRLRDKYKVRFMDLDVLPCGTEFLTDERHHAKPVRFSKFLTDPDVYLVSAAMLKTHDRAVLTLGLKNVAVGAILKDTGFRWGPGSKGTTDKHLVHGGDANQGIHFNLFSLARRCTPHLTVLDGFEGMEHNGPLDGTPVDHRVAVAGTDWLAVDRLGAELMGFDYKKVGYLAFAEQAYMGETNLARMEILGARLEECVRPYKPHDTIDQQYGWM